MGAAEDNEDDANGVQRGTGPSGNNANVGLPWRMAYVRGRSILKTTLNKLPYHWPGNSPATTSIYDQTQGIAEQTAWRYVDSKGQVWDNLKLHLVQIEWLQDGCPTPLTQAKLADYVVKANVLRDWPAGFPGAFAGEPQTTYPAWPATS